MNDLNNVGTQTILMAREKVVEESSWDFKGCNTKYSTHGYHTYPAMMIPQIARRLMQTYGKKAEVVLDPFVGSGTVLVEATLLSNFKKAYGIDINPLALLISEVKTSSIDSKKLMNEYENLIGKINKTKNKTTDVPRFFNIEFWFKPKVIKELAVIKKCINDIPNKKIRNFFLVAFSETVRAVSNTRNGEYKLYRLAPPKLEKFNPEPISYFDKRAFKNIEKMTEYNNERNKCKVKPLAEDARFKTSLLDNSVDLVVTSPPYGDSRTTVAYGQFSRLALQWMDFEAPIVKNIDKIGLGGIPTQTLQTNLKSPILNKVIETISSIDKKRAKDVLSFYEDFWKCVQELDRVTKSGAYLCFVVGNRTVKKTIIPTDRIITELFESLGNYDYVKTTIRNIPSKRLPKSNSPSNIIGDLGSTMNTEHIVILKKKEGD